MKNLVQRLIGGVSILVLLLVFSFLPTGYFTLFILGLSLTALYEFSLAFTKDGWDISYWLGAVGSVPLILFAYFQWDGLILGWLSLFLIIVATLELLRTKIQMERISFYVFVSVYLGVGFSHLVLIKPTPFLWLVYIIAWGTDTFAYCIGSLFGRHPLAPMISPKKSIEGSLGGIGGALILSMIYGHWAKLPIGSATLIPLVIIGSILSQSGDLVASSIKRRVGVKDYGFIITGHGGVMDRFDSMLFVAPYAYFLIQLFSILQ